MTPDDIRTATDDTRLWLERAVIGLNLCPFAKGVHTKQQVRYAVCTSDDPAVLLEDLRTSCCIWPRPTPSSSTPPC